MKVTKIETFRERHGVRFAGTLRNQYSFDLKEDIFIKYDGKMIQCKVIGKELPPRDNADYIYKIELPNGVDSPVKEDTVSLQCDKIFKSKEDAKQSALRHLDSMYKLDKENIESFFKEN